MGIQTIIMYPFSNSTCKQGDQHLNLSAFPISVRNLSFSKHKSRNASHLCHYYYDAVMSFKFSDQFQIHREQAKMKIFSKNYSGSCYILGDFLSKDVSTLHESQSGMGKIKPHANLSEFRKDNPQDLKQVGELETQLPDLHMP